MRLAKRSLLVGIALLAIATTVVTIRSRTPAEHSVISPANEQASPGAATLEGSLHAIAAGDSASPRDRWDPDYVADHLRRNRQAIIRWVRANTYWIPYRGVLRGPAGVLLDRQGNSLDRALLLAAMLSRAGDTVRLAHGQLTRAQALAILPELIASRRRAALRALARGPEPEWRSDVQRVAARYHLEPASIAKLMEARLDSVARMFELLDARTNDQSRRLATLLGNNTHGQSERDRVDSQVEALRDHWWVQRLIQGVWTDVDLLDPLSTESGDTARATVSPDALDSASYHLVVLRLIVERWAASRLSQQPVLERQLRPAELVGKSISLVIQPTGWSGGLVANRRDPMAALRELALEQQSWQATLGIDREVLGETVIARNGGALGSGGDGLGSGGGLFGGLGHGVASTGGGGDGGGELTGMWLEYEIHTPGEEPRRIRRQLFDLIGPAARARQAPSSLSLTEPQRLERSLALMRSTEILLQASGVAPEFVLHLMASATLANGELLRFSSRRELAGNPSSDDSLRSLASPPPSQLYTLAAVRLPGNPDPDVFIDRPNILSRHDFLAPAASGIVRRAATDIVANEVGLALDAPRPIEARLRQGVRDTNAEALLNMGQPALRSVAEAFAASGEWTAVTSATSAGQEHVGEDARTRMTDDLVAGYILVAPVRRDAARNTEQIGWWRIDPRTGNTLGVFADGWGQASERMVLQRAVIVVGTMAEAWAFEFLYCHGAFTTPNGPGQLTRANRLIDAIVPPLAAEQADVCVWNAYTAAITAGLVQGASVVWGLLMKQLRLQSLMSRPLFQSGEVGPGEAPPLLGKGSAPTTSPTEPPPCPPGSGTPEGAAASAEGEEVNPLASTKPATSGENPSTPGGGNQPANAKGGDEINPLGTTQPANAAGEPPGGVPAGPQPPKPAGEDPAAFARTQPASGTKQPEEFDPFWGDPKPEDPGELSENLANALARRQAAQRGVDQASRQLADAQRKVNAINQSPPPGDRDLAGQERVSNANADLGRAEGAMGEARLELGRAEKQADYYSGMQPANDALIQARDAKRAAADQFMKELQQGADFQGAEWNRYKAASDRYEQALQAWRNADRQWLSQPGPGNAYPGARGETQALPNSPLPPGATQPLPNGPVGASCQGGAGGGLAAGKGAAAAPAPSLGDIENQWRAANDELGQVQNDLDEANLALFKAQKAAKQGGGPVPNDDASRELFFKKMDQLERVEQLGREYQAAGGKLDGYGRPISQTSSSPGQMQVMVGLGGMKAP